MANKSIMIVIGMLVIVCACNRSKTTTEIAIPPDFPQTKKAVSEMVARCDARVAWEDSLGIAPAESFYTIELQNAMIGTRPLLVYAFVLDVARTNDHLLVKLEPQGWDGPGDYVQYYINAEEGHVTRLLAPPNSERWKSGIAAVIRVLSVERVAFEAWANTADSSEESRQISISNCPDQFVARGSLIDFVAIEDLNDYALALTAREQQ